MMSSGHGGSFIAISSGFQECLGSAWRAQSLTSALCVRERAMVMKVYNQHRVIALEMVIWSCDNGTVTVRLQRYYDE
jgi:hypothetical protein